MAGGEPTKYAVHAAMIEALNAETRYRELSGTNLSPWEAQEALALPFAELKADSSDFQFREYMIALGMERIVQGSLRLAAHQALGERPHFGGKYSEDLITEGIKTLEEAKKPRQPVQKPKPMTPEERAAIDALLNDLTTSPSKRKKPRPSRSVWADRPPKPKQ
jgi:hypothetical protein